MQTMRKAPCTCFLIAANVIVFLVLSMQGMTEDAIFMMSKGAMYVPDILAYGSYYTIFTSIFLHFGIEHLINNMIVLTWSGWRLEQVAGSLKTAVIYLVSGICGNLLSGYLEYIHGDYAVSAGASGAIFGLTGALLFIAIRNRGSIYGLTKRSLLLMIVLNLYMGFTSEGVDNAAHIGGLIAGFVMAAILCHRKLSQWKRDKEYSSF